MQGSVIINFRVEGYPAPHMFPTCHLYSACLPDPAHLPHLPFLSGYPALAPLWGKIGSPCSWSWYLLCRLLCRSTQDKREREREREKCATVTQLWERERKSDSSELKCQCLPNTFPALPSRYTVTFRDICTTFHVCPALPICPIGTLHRLGFRGVALTSVTVTAWTRVCHTEFRSFPIDERF